MEKNSKKGGIIALIVILSILLIGGAGFGFYYFNRPIYKINKAIENDDIETIAKLYGDLKKESDEKSVRKAMMKHCSELEQAFIDKDIDYDEITEELDLLGEEVLADEDDFEELVNRVNELNDSRVAYAKAQDAYEEGDYESALSELKKITLADEEEFEDTQSLIEECEEILKPDIAGLWECSIDAGEAITDYLGYDLAQDCISVPIKINLEFTDDTKGRVYLDEETLKNSISDVLDIVIDLAIDEIAKEYGIDVTTAKGLIKSVYGSDVKTLFLEDFDMDDMLSEFGDTSYDFKYLVEENEIRIYDADSQLPDDTLPYERLFYGDDVILLEDFGDGFDIDIDELGLELPLRFIRVE